MGFLPQFPSGLISLRRGNQERIIFVEAQILQALLEPQQVVDMREEGLVQSRGLLGREIVARHAISLAGGVAQFQESQQCAVALRSERRPACSFASSP